MAKRKKMQAPEGTHEDEVMEEAETTSCSMEISEYASNKYHYEKENDSDDRSDNDDHIETFLSFLSTTK